MSRTAAVLINRYSIASSAIVLALLITLSPNADARVRSKTECSDRVCLTVWRDGTFVRSIVPAVQVLPLGRFYGHTETRGPGFRHNTPDREFRNVSGTTFASHVTWLGYDLNRHYPKGSLFCTQFWLKVRDGWSSPGDECIKL